MDDCIWISCDHCQKSAGGGFGRAPASFPMLDSIEAEAKRVRKDGLRHVQFAANRFDIDFGRNASLVAGLFSCKESLNLIEPGHHVFEYGGYVYPRYLEKTA
jgi:hypothetical protein